MTAYIFSFLIAFFAAILFTPAVQRLSLKTNILDFPGERKIHNSPVPRLGGVSLYGAILAAMAVGIPLAKSMGMRIHTGTFLGIGLASFGILIIGILDDKWGLPPIMKMLGQLGCALVVIGFGMTIPFFSNPLGGVVPLYVLAIPLTLFWIVGVTNAVNLIDGLDGLAAGLSTIAGITLFFVALRTHQIEAALLLAGVVGATLGFLRFNFYPASIFLGDSGSLLLGFLLSTASVLGVLKTTLVIAFVIPMLALGIPIFDTVSAIFRRIKIGAHPFQADQHHLHHLMLAQGLTQRGVVLILYAVAVFLCGGAFLITAFNKEDSLWVIVGLIAVAMMIGQMVWLKLYRAVKEASHGA